MTTRLDPDVLATLRGRSLLTTHDWTTDELEAVLAVADRFQQLDRAGASTALIPNELAYAMFFDNSTRTKSAWAGAAARLGMQPVIVDGSSTQVSHGETAEETGAMLGMNAHALGVRHDLILGEGNAFMHDVKRGIDDYLDRHRRPTFGADRQPPVRHRPPDPDDGRSALVASALRWLRRRQADRRVVGILAQLRQAVVGAARPGVVADPLRRPRHTRPPRGVRPAARPDAVGPRRRSPVGRFVRGHRRHGRRLRRRRRRVPQVVGASGADVRTGRRQQGPRHRRDCTTSSSGRWP